MNFVIDLLLEIFLRESFGVEPCKEQIYDHEDQLQSEKGEPTKFPFHFQISKTIHKHCHSLSGLNELVTTDIFIPILC